MYDKIIRKIIEKLEKEFIKEDKEEPFLNREYVEETKRIYKLLKEEIDSEENPTDRAIYDIVNDIFRELDREK